MFEQVQTLTTKKVFKFHSGPRDWQHPICKESASSASFFSQLWEGSVRQSIQLKQLPDDNNRKWSPVA